MTHRTNDPYRKYAGGKISKTGFYILILNLALLIGAWVIVGFVLHALTTLVMSIF